MRLGIFGGTFDPPHTGHLLAASDAYEVMELDRLIFVPSARQPLKVGAVEGSPAQRLEMLRRMTRDDPRFEVDPVEIDRPGLSYTVDTLAAFAERYPVARRFFLIGEDLVPQLPSWRDPERIAGLAELVVLSRSGDTRSGTWAAGAAPRVPVTRIATRRVEISSTEVRERARAGKPLRGFVSDGVAELIHAAGLYR